MTCGMLCVMRKERRGVLHLDKYSPPKANLFGGGGGGGGGGGCGGKRREKGKRKRKKKNNGKEREPAVL